MPIIRFKNVNYNSVEEAQAVYLRWLATARQLHEQEQDKEAEKYEDDATRLKVLIDAK